jgi:hypothetical protein
VEASREDDETRRQGHAAACEEVMRGGDIGAVAREEVMRPDDKGTWRPS